MTGPAISMRPGTPADAEALDHIALASEEPADPPVLGTPGAHAPYLRYLAERGTVVVAEVGGTPVGFGASVRTGRSTHLADLFILPEWQSHGIGRRLLEAVLGDDQPRTTFASGDPRAMPLYLRAGMGAYWPNLYLSGDPRRLPSVDPSVRVVDVDVERVAELDGRWTGADRRPDVPFWASLPEVQPFIVERVGDGREVGAGIARARLSGPGRWVVRGVAAPEADGAAVLLAAMVHGLARTELGGVCLPGSAPLVRTLLEAGFRIVDRDVFLASDPSIVDPLREIIDSSVL